MKHGGDLLSYQHLYDGELLDFSSNINPFGYPKILDEALAQGASALTAYPDRLYRRLRRAIADYLDCAPDEVLLGNGSVDILDFFCREAVRVVICAPCFTEYRERAELADTPVVSLTLPPDFIVSAELFEGQLSAGDIVLLGHPNNPTGRMIPKAARLKLQQLTLECGAILVLDEAFIEFCETDDDSIQLFRDAPNVCVIRAATKFFGLPGLRLGYAWAHPRIARAHERVALPWRINALADCAGQVIFHDAEYIQRAKAFMAQERRFLAAALSNMPAIQVYPTDANFLLFRLLTMTENSLFEALARRGFVIRKASTFDGLDEHYVRIAIKDHASNQRLLAALQEILRQN